MLYSVWSMCASTTTTTTAAAAAAAAAMAQIYDTQSLFILFRVVWATECCGTMVLYPVKIYRLHCLNKTLIGQ